MNTPRIKRKLKLLNYQKADYFTVMTFDMKVYCIVVLNLYILLSKLVYSATFLKQLAATFVLLHGAL